MKAKALRDKSKKVHSLAVRLDDETKNALDELAREDDRTTSEYIRRALKQHVQREQERKQGK